MRDEGNGDFRETELGTLPVEWNVTTIGELFAIQQGASLSPKRRKGDSPRPFLRTANVFWSYLDLSKVDSMDFTDAEAEKLALRSRDLLVCEGGDIGRTAMWRGEIKDCCYQNHLHRLRAIDSNIESEFYVYWMQAAFTLLDLYKGEGNKTTIPNLSQSRLKSFAVPIPPLPEQRAIARVLSTIQRAMETQDNLIAAARELKKSLMRQLFTQGLNANGAVQETEIGVMPEHWELVKLGDVASSPLKNGIFVKNPKWGEGIAYLNVADVYPSSSVNIRLLERMSISNDEVSKYRVNMGDVVFVRSSLKREGIAQATTVLKNDEPIVYDNHLIKFSPDGSKLNSLYLSEYCRSEFGHGRLVALSKTTTMTTIPQSNLANFVFPLPPLSEQGEIARILATADKKIETEEKRKAALQALFKTMLQQLMTGQIRVTNLSYSTP